MNFLKSHFAYNKKQRNGIFFLLAIILVLQGVFFFVDFSTNQTIDFNNEEIALFQKEFDSIQTQKLETKKRITYPFNPNYITDYKGFQLGMSVDEIDRLHEFRAKGKFVNSSVQFKNVTHINDSLLSKIKPFFKFPSWVKAQSKRKNNFIVREGIPLIKKNINLADASEFKSVSGIGEKLANRIVTYRKKLQGFSFNDQLYEVWGLEKHVTDKALQYFEVVNPPIIDKLDINEASFKEVLKVVYIDYELTKKIFNYKDEVAEIQDIEELKKIDGFPIDKFSRITLYLEVK